MPKHAQGRLVMGKSQENSKQMPLPKAGELSDGVSTGGRWSPQEAQLHINALELLAVLWGLQALCSSEHHCHIKVLSDNTTTVSYLRNMGGSQSIPCNDIARDIWLWCKDRDIWITPAHIPGVGNIEADSASRVFNPFPTETLYSRS